MAAERRDFAGDTKNRIPVNHAGFCSSTHIADAVARRGQLGHLGDDTVAVMFDEILDAAAMLDDLDDAARVEAWASSVLGVWAEDPDARVIDGELINWLAASDDPRAALVLAALSPLIPVDELHRAAIERGDAMPPPWLDHLGTATATRAWEVRRGDTASVGIGFVSSDSSEHSLLADIVDQRLAALIVAPGPDDLFDGIEDLIDPEPVDSVVAARRIVDSWRALLDHPDEIPESLYVNGALARARLGPLVDDPLDDLRAVPAVAPWDDPVDPVERAELDQWALSVLDRALPPTDVAAPDPLVVDELASLLLAAHIAVQPALEREAYAAVEWADWLGLVIGLVRSGAGVVVSPVAMVDAINRCPEVTSSIPRRDRPYFEWVLAIVLVVWQRCGVVDAEGRLTSEGLVLLPAALRVAWRVPLD